MRTFMFTVVALALLLPVSSAVADFVFDPWQSLGAQDDLLNGIDFSSNYPDFYLFATTEEGFHVYNLSTGQWTDRTWPGWIGKARYAVLASAFTDDRLVAGGVNAWFKGTISVSEDLGETDTLVYESSGGRITDMDQWKWDTPVMYACTWSDIVDGELLRSYDDGDTWTPVTGHGHHNMTAVRVTGEQEIFVAGDNYVTWSQDGGQTWTNLQNNLPEGQGLYCMYVGEPVSSVPGRWPQDSYISAILVSNDTGLYNFDFLTEQWELVLPYACRAVGSFFRQLDTFVYWSETYVVTFDGRVLATKSRNWDQWQDVTAGLEPGVPIDLVTRWYGVYVATDVAGVFRSEGMPVTDVPEAGEPVRLTAYPNPFNPGTELEFTTPLAGRALLQVYDLRGALVGTILDEAVDAGTWTVPWRPQGLGSGTYHAVLHLNGERIVRPVMLLK